MNSLYANPSFGNAGGKREFISYEARAILVEKVLSCSTSQSTQDELAKLGIKRASTGVMLWMRQTRQWLGLPPVYPSTKSERYKAVVEKWIEENGFPTREEILNGWLPGRK